MPRNITIRGTGKISVSPDLTVVTLNLKDVDKDYEKAMEKAASKMEDLRGALAKIGFSKEDLKTTNFNVNTEYESRRNQDGSYSQVFKGFACYHSLKIEFDFDTKKLANVLSSIASSVAEPELNVSFTVKDKDAVSDMLLKSATENAKRKAEILTSSSDVKLGRIISIVYDWGNRDLVSPTRYALDNRAMKLSAAPNSIDISPDDITVTDTVTFIWEIG